MIGLGSDKKRSLLCRWDRQWAVMQNGRVLTQKREPLLAQIQVTEFKIVPRIQNGKFWFVVPQTKIDSTRGVLTLSCQGEGEVTVPLVRTICLFGHSCVTNCHWQCPKNYWIIICNFCQLILQSMKLIKVAQDEGATCSGSVCGER